MLGTVVSHRMNKTAIVSVERHFMDKVTMKRMKARTKFKAHDEKNESRVGDLVLLVESAPISREKRWKIEKLEVNQPATVSLAGVEGAS